MERLIKNFNNLFNVEFNADEEAERVLRYILHKATTQEAMQIFNRLENKFQNEMEAREQKAAKVCRIVRSKYPRTVEVANLIVNDPIFLEPIKQ